MRYGDDDGDDDGDHNDNHLVDVNDLVLGLLQHLLGKHA